MELPVSIVREVIAVIVNLVFLATTVKQVITDIFDRTVACYIITPEIDLTIYSLQNIHVSTIFRSWLLLLINSIDVFYVIIYRYKRMHK